MSRTPVLFVSHGARLPGDRAGTVSEGVRHGTLSMRSFALRPVGDPADLTRSPT